MGLMTAWNTDMYLIAVVKLEIHIKIKDHLPQAKLWSFEVFGPNLLALHWSLLQSFTFMFRISNISVWASLKRHNLSKCASGASKLVPYMIYTCIALFFENMSEWALGEGTGSPGIKFSVWDCREITWWLPWDGTDFDRQYIVCFIHGYFIEHWH